ncbi:MAG: ParB N-terminal domain-containing protein [Cellulosilyticaceae bacterium]
MANKSLMSLADIYGNADNLSELEIQKLDSFSNHPFNLYDGERLQDMIRSIKELGVITPVIVRKKGERFEILAGHNRTNAAHLAGLNKVPAIIKENISDEEAMWIVTETNLIQRAFADMLHSERALVLYRHHAILKEQGKRTDLLKEVEQLEAEYITSCQLGQRLLSNEVAGENYHLSGRTVSRYIRIYELIDELKDRLDKGGMPFVATVELSYLGIEQQQIVDRVLQMHNMKINIKQAEKIKKCKDQDDFSEELVYLILRGKPSQQSNTYGVNKKIILDFFEKDTEKKEIERIIREALEVYFNNHKE